MQSPVLLDHTAAIEWLKLTSLKIDARPVLKAFATPVSIDTDGEWEAAGEVLVRTR